MNRRSSRRDGGLALLTVVFTMVIVLTILGAVIGSVGRSAVFHRHARFRAGAEALAQGAWCAAQQGIARHGSAYPGLKEKTLGAGTIAVVLSKDGSSGLWRVTATGTVPGDKGPVRAVVTGIVEIEDGEPAGSKLARVADQRLQ